MNERKRIKELADKAIEDMPGAWNIPDEFCKKFAELIREDEREACAKEIAKLRKALSIIFVNANDELSEIAFNALREVKYDRR
jgi:hypothetical protein